MDCSQPSFWLDVTKTFIGALLGAGLAFGSSLYIQWRLRIQDNIRAGNLALALLAGMLNSFLGLRVALLQTQQEVLRQNSKAPFWMQFKPTHHNFLQSASFDLSGLAFLFDKEGVGIIEELRHAESLYDSMRLLIPTHREVRELIQERHFALGIAPGVTILKSELEAKVGVNLIEKGNVLSQVLIAHLATDEDVYRKAFAHLRADLARRYGNKF